jgi:hypothetical protein
MSVFDIIVIVAVSVAFVAVVGTIIYRKVKGKSSGCDCGCQGCPHCSACHPSPKSKGKDEVK